MDKYINIKWQEGTIPEAGVNGAQINDVLDVAVKKLKEFQDKFPCPENEISILGIEAAIAWQNERTANREARNVEGKNII